MASPAGAAATPRYGGVLTYMIPADAPPSFDVHREQTYAMIHTAAPFYSVLVRFSPYDPGSTTDIVCDVCTKVPSHYLNQDSSTIWLAPPHCGECTAAAPEAAASKHVESVK
jgi:hypothetical protein